MQQVVTSTECQSCRPSYGQPRPRTTKKLPALSSPHNKQQNLAKKYRQKSLPSPENLPKEACRSSTTTVLGHLSSLHQPDRSHRRTSHHLQLVPLITDYKPKYSPTAKSLICHWKIETKFPIEINSAKTFHYQCYRPQTPSATGSPRKA